MMIEVKMEFIQIMAEAYLSDLSYKFDMERELLECRKKEVVQRTIEAMVECEKQTKQTQAQYDEAKSRSDGSWESMMWACCAMGIDNNRLIAVVKSMNRKSKSLNWEKCFFLKDHQIGGLLAEGNIFMKSWHDGKTAYKVTRFLP